MTKPLLAILLVLPLSTLAQTQVPNVFEDGTPAKAAEVNANFDALETAIDAIPIYQTRVWLPLPRSDFPRSADNCFSVP